MVALPTFLDQERQPGGPLPERRRQPVGSMQIADGAEDFGQLVVELDLGCRARLVRLVDAIPQQTQPLDGVDAIHGALERQVHVVLLEEHESLVDDRPAVIQRELARRPQETAELPGRGAQLWRAPDLRFQEPGAIRQQDILAIELEQTLLGEVREVAARDQLVQELRVVGDGDGLQPHRSDEVREGKRSKGELGLLLFELQDDAHRRPGCHGAAVEQPFGPGLVQRLGQLGQPLHRISQDVDGIAQLEVADQRMADRVLQVQDPCRAAHLDRFRAEAKPALHD
jgi:hypothetical protein